MTKASRLSAVAGSPARKWSNRSRSAVSTSRAASRIGQLFLGLALELRLAHEQRQLGGHRVQHVVGGDLRRRACCRGARPRRAAPSAAPRGSRSHACRPATSGWCCSRSGGTRRLPPARRLPIPRGPMPRRAAPPRRPRSAAAPWAWPPISASRLSRRPPGKCSTASAGMSSLVFSSAAAQDQRISTPRNRYAFDRHSRYSRAGWNCSAPKISVSGLKRMEVPRRLCTGPALTSLVVGLPLGVGLLPQHAVARHLHLHLLGQRVDHGTADAVQAAGGVVGLAAELPARMQGRENDLQRTEILEFRMRVDRDATAIVAHRQPVACLHRHLDEAGMAGHRLVHGVVEDFGGQMVQRGSRRCRRYTCRDAGGRVPAPPAPRCPWRSSPSCRAQRRCPFATGRAAGFVGLDSRAAAARLPLPFSDSDPNKSFMLCSL